MRRSIVAIVFLLSVLVPAKSWAWGCTGHQVVAYIAAENLNPTATAKVADLLSDVTYGDFKRYCAPTKLGNIEFYATWADDARTDANAGWHFWTFLWPTRPPPCRSSATPPAASSPH